MNRIGLVVHPRRDIASALASLQGWGDTRSVEVVQVPAAGQQRRVAPERDPAACDLIIALGGDGTAIGAAAAVGQPAPVGARRPRQHHVSMSRAQIADNRRPG